MNEVEYLLKGPDHLMSWENVQRAKNPQDMAGWRTSRVLCGSTLQLLWTRHGANINPSRFTLSQSLVFSCTFWAYCGVFWGYPSFGKAPGRVSV